MYLFIIHQTQVAYSGAPSLPTSYMPVQQYDATTFPRVSNHQQQVVVTQPQAIATATTTQVVTTKKVDWSSHLCDCCSDMKTCKYYHKLLYLINKRGYW